MGKLEGKTAIVTGAGRGIGRGIALRLAKDGAHVVVGSRSENTVNQVVGEITATSHSAIGFTVDVGVADQVAAMVDKTLQTFGGVDILVNVAQSWGRPDSKSMSPPETPFEDISDEERVGRARQWHGLEGVDYVKEETHKEAFIWDAADKLSSNFQLVHGKDNSPFGRSVDLGDDEAGDVDRLGESLRLLDRILPDRPVKHQ